MREPLSEAPWQRARELLVIWTHHRLVLASRYRFNCLLTTARSGRRCKYAQDIGVCITTRLQPFLFVVTAIFLGIPVFLKLSVSRNAWLLVVTYTTRCRLWNIWYVCLFEPRFNFCLNTSMVLDYIAELDTDQLARNLKKPVDFSESEDLS